MALVRATVRKRGDLPSHHDITDVDHSVRMIVPRARVEAIRAAAAIRERALAEAHAIVSEARSQAANARETAIREGREEASASLAASVFKHRERENRALAHRENDILDISRALAERLLGRALELSPNLIVDLARQAIRAVARARRIRLFVHPDDADALRAGIGDLDVTAPHLEVHLDATLARGSLRADTDLGSLDGSIPLQLDRLVRALRT